MKNDIGKKIKLLRISNKLNQNDLSKILNLSRSQISNLENGKRNVSIIQLEKICEYFKIDMSYFIMFETNDVCIEILNKLRTIFESNKLTQEQKDDLFSSIMRIYLDYKK